MGKKIGRIEIDPDLIPPPAVINISGEGPPARPRRKDKTSTE